MPSRAGGGNRSGSHAGPIGKLRAERERLKQEHEQGLSGRKLVQALTAAMDAAVRAVWSDAVDVPDRIALVALGGYGREELSPHSDVDLMVLHAARSIAPDVGKRLFYELWDAGFAVGHAIRTVKDCVRLAAANLEAETSFLDARFLDGDEAMFEEFRAATLKQTRKRGARFVDTLRAATAARHLKEGSASYFLEPNIKEGAGGLRDRATIGWLATAFDTASGLAADPELESATDVLLHVRNQLHYMTDRRADLLILQQQEAVAEGLGYQGNGRPAVDAFLRDLYVAARHVGYSARSALAEVAGEIARRPAPVRDVAPGIELSSTGLRIFDRRPIAEVPDLPMRAFAIAAAEDVPIAAETMLWLRSAASPESLKWNDATRRAFFEILGRGRPGRSALEAMDHAGLLVRYLPDWEAVRCLPQHNVYHRFTVDVHLLTAVLEACRLGEPAPDGPDALAHEVWRDLADRNRVLLACLLHDIGKGRDDDHSILGEELAARICARMGLAREVADDVVWLVRHHLLLSDTATRRDTSDENLVVETAAWVGSAERLKMLYVLSVADGRATGPAAWNPWKATLVGELFTKVLRVLEEGRLVGPDATDLVRLRGTELRAALTRYPKNAVDAHLSGMPRAYFLAFPTEALIRHFALLTSPPDGGSVSIHVAKTEAPGVYELDVVAPDRPGLFSKVAGGLALNGINVLAAQIFTRADGAALEVFRVSGAHEDEIDPGRWDRVRADIGAAIAGELRLDERLEQKREVYARPSKGKREPSRVLVENGASDFFTLVEVHATDRVGLLYAITDALSDLELDIHTARIATYAEDVVDVFYVRDVVGQKITDRQRIHEIEHTVLERIGA